MSPRRRLAAREDWPATPGRATQSGPGIDRLIAVSLLVMAASRFVPYAAVQFYVQSIACCAALLPLAYEIWRQPRSANAPTAVAVEG